MHVVMCFKDTTTDIVNIEISNIRTICVRTRENQTNFRKGISY